MHRCFHISSNQEYLGSHLFCLNTSGIANVVLLKTLEHSYTVMYDSDKHDGAFIVEMTQGNVVFNRCPMTGVPFIDLDNHAEDGAMMIIQAVWENYEGFTKRQILQATEARKMQGMLGHPSEEEFLCLLKDKDNVSHTLLKNCLVTSDNACTIFGLSLPRVLGVTTRKKPR